MNIDTDEDFPEHPKTLRFCAIIRQPNAWGYLWKLWRWCRKYQPDGDLTTYQPEEIEAAVGWGAMDGQFFEAAVRAGFIDRDDRGVRVHNWMRRMGKALLRLEMDRLRKAASRARADHDAETADAYDRQVEDIRRKLADVSPRSEGRPVDVHRTSGGQPTDVHRTADGIQPPSAVSALLCNDLQGKVLPRETTRARDPSATPASRERTSYDWLHYFSGRHAERHGRVSYGHGSDGKASGTLSELLKTMAPSERTEAWDRREAMVEEFFASADLATQRAGYLFAFFVNAFQVLRAPPEKRPQAVRAGPTAERERQTDDGIREFLKRKEAAGATRGQRAIRDGDEGGGDNVPDAGHGRPAGLLRDGSG